MGIQERKERERLRRKNDIILSAEQLLFDPEGENATMDAIAENAELSKGTLYLYFKNKQDLQYAIAEKGVIILRDALHDNIDLSLTGAEQLSSLGYKFVEYVDNNPKYLELIIHFENTDYVGDDQKPRILIQPALEVLRSVIKNGQDDNTIITDFSDKELAIILWSQMIGLMQTILRYEKYNNIHPIDKNSLIKGHFKLVIKGISQKN